MVALRRRLSTDDFKLIRGAFDRTRAERDDRLIWRLPICVLVLCTVSHLSTRHQRRGQLTSTTRPKCFDSFSMTRLYGICCVSFRRAWTLSECRASRAESRTLDECAPSLSESRIEYSLSDLPRPWFRSYSSKVICD